MLASIMSTMQGDPHVLAGSYSRRYSALSGTCLLQYLVI